MCLDDSFRRDEDHFRGLYACVYGMEDGLIEGRKKVVAVEAGGAGRQLWWSECLTPTRRCGENTETFCTPTNSLSHCIKDCGRKKTGKTLTYLQFLKAHLTMAQVKASAATAPAASPVLNTERHIKYYLRCLKTFLPSAYISNDSNRMLLAFLTLTGLDVLNALNSKTTPEERQTYIDWVYHCQVPSGGFRGFSGTDFGSDNRRPENEAWDPANVPATFFALVNLLILGDDLARVKREECLRWLPKLQRDDGSFGEVLGPGQSVEGNSDLRYCCCAAGIRFILRGSGKGVEDVEDIDVPRFIEFIQACQVSWF